MLNFTAYIGHTALRLYVMGDAAYERAATTEEIDRMCMGIASGFPPPPNLKDYLEAVRGKCQSLFDGGPVSARHAG